MTSSNNKEVKVEDYSEDPRGASCLVLGYDLNKRPIHLVCGSTPSEKLRIITQSIFQHYPNGLILKQEWGKDENL